MTRQKMQCLIGYKVIVLAVNVLISFPVKSNLNNFSTQIRKEGPNVGEKSKSSTFVTLKVGF